METSLSASCSHRSKVPGALPLSFAWHVPCHMLFIFKWEWQYFVLQCCEQVGGWLPELQEGMGLPRKCEVMQQPCAPRRAKSLGLWHVVGLSRLQPGIGGF